MIVRVILDVIVMGLSVVLAGFKTISLQGLLFNFIFIICLDAYFNLVIFAYLFYKNPNNLIE